MGLQGDRGFLGKNAWEMIDFTDRNLGVSCKSSCFKEGWLSPMLMLIKSTTDLVLGA